MNVTIYLTNGAIRHFCGVEDQLEQYDADARGGPRLTFSYQPAMTTAREDRKKAVFYLSRIAGYAQF